MSENLKIIDVIEHMGNNGTYYTIETDKGMLNIYDEELTMVLEKNIGKVVSLELKTPKSGKTYIASIAKSEQPASPSAVSSFPPSASKASDKDKAIRAAVAFKGAIDLCVAGIITKEEIRDRMLIFYAELKELEK